MVYWPPEYNKDFLNDFFDFLAEKMHKYDCVIAVGDFNVHMAKDLLNPTDSFNLDGWAHTRTRTHT